VNVSFVANAFYVEGIAEAAYSFYREVTEIKTRLFEYFPEN